jgi:gas vesicle protein
MPIDPARGNPDQPPIPAAFRFLRNHLSNCGIPLERVAPTHETGEDNMSMGKFWAAFGVGVAAGAALALIYAPQSGERTRRQLRRGYEDASDRLRSTAKTVRSTANDVSDQAGKYFKRGKDVVSDVVDSAQDLANAASKRVASFR